AGELVDRARGLGYPPVLAFALTIAARDELTAFRPAPAEELFEQALAQADAGGDDAQRFEIELGLGRRGGIELDRVDDGRRHADRANALLVRTGGGATRESRLLDVQALLALRAGKLSEAEKLARAAVAGASSDEVDRASHLA